MVKRNALDLDAHEADFLVSPGNARTWQAGGSLYDDPLQHRNYISRFIVAVMSAIIVLGGAAIAVIGRVQKDKHLFSLCPKCDSIVIIMYIAGSAIAVIGFVGLVGACTRLKPVAFFFTAVIVLLSLCTTAAGIAFAVYYEGLHEGDLKKLWADAVRDDPQIVCDLQDQLQCSGFDACCNMTATAGGNWSSWALESRPRVGVLRSADSGMAGALVGAGETTQAPAPIFPFPNACNITEPEFNLQCSKLCSDTNNKYSATCSARARHELKEHVAVILGCLFGAAALLFITAVASVRMTLRS